MAVHTIPNLDAVLRYDAPHHEPRLALRAEHQTLFNSVDVCAMFVRSALTSSIALAILLSTLVVWDSITFKISKTFGHSEPNMTPRLKLNTFYLTSPCGGSSSGRSPACWSGRDLAHLLIHGRAPLSPSRHLQRGSLFSTAATIGWHHYHATKNACKQQMFSKLEPPLGGSEMMHSNHGSIPNIGHD
jgi:hypothetical protein